MPSKFTPLTDAFHVSPQISVADVATAAAEGYTLIVNNRPDGEVPGQPKSADIEAAAKRAGLAYVHIPVSGGISMSHISALKSALDDAGTGKTLAYCRSGTRSTFVHSHMSAANGGAADEIIAHAAAAGYDISEHAAILENLRQTGYEPGEESN